MKIKRTSWHYKFNNSIFDVGDKYNTLCEYFWKTVLHIGVVIGIIFLIIFLIITWILSFIDDPWGWAIVISVIGCIGLPPLAIYLLRKKFPPEKTSITPNIVKEYYKAFKDKYCPIIDYIDDDY